MMWDCQRAFGFRPQMKPLFILLALWPAGLRQLRGTAAAAPVLPGNLHEVCLGLSIDGSCSAG